MANENELEWAWFAGFFDGEGCVRGRSYWRHDKAKPRHSVDVSLVVTQRDREVLDKIQKLTGIGAVTSRTGATMPAFHWVVTGHLQVTAILHKLLPYAVVKREQILVALEVIERCNQRKGRGYPLTEEELEERISLLEKLSALKKHWLAPSHRLHQKMSVPDNLSQ